jgi:serine/threonine protein kinase
MKNDMAGRTIRPDADNKTLRPVQGRTEHTLRVEAESTMDRTLRAVSATQDKTLHPDRQKEIDAITRPYETEYHLNRGTYRIIRPISEGTGEAQVFLVKSEEKEYVLKLYYAGIEPPPNHEILEVIRQTPHSGKLVDVLEHGVWKNPLVQGEERHYEVMTYCRGGSLDQITFKGNEEGMSDFAVQAAAAIHFCHEHGFIHRDIKPGNFFFLDGTHKQVVLGDFGISVKCDKSGVVRTDQARTRIYAAPEMYYTVPGENMVEIDTKSDYYSLGMVLLCLWMGEREFKEREFELMKRKRTGNLPFPDDLSEHLLQLIKALTVPQPEKRCGFADILRWAKGENIYTQTLGQQSERTFHIIFNAGKEQIAHSPEQLADFMREDHELAIKYLYTGKLTKWLGDNQRPELGAEIEEIVEKKYPKEQVAGLYAACYALNIDMPYYDVKHRPCVSAEEIARSLSDSFDLYQSLLQDANNSLFIFFRVHDLGQLADETTALFAQQGQQREALLRLIYSLDPTRPYVLTDEKGKKAACETPEEVLRFAYAHSVGDISWRDLRGDSFLVWLSAHDKKAAAKIRTELKGCDIDNNSTTYAVLYNLSPKVSFTLQLDEEADDYYFTHTQVAHYFNHELMVYSHSREGDAKHDYAAYLLGMLSKLDGSRLYFYLKSKGVYDDKIEWINYCFELDSKDNLRKAGPYNWIVATFKMIKGLNAQPFYYLQSSKKTLLSPAELKTIPPKEVKEELESGYLKEWLTVFFQEDPQKDFSAKFSYEEETIKYVEFIGSLDSQDADVQNYKLATGYINKQVRKMKLRVLLLTLMRLTLGVVSVFPLLLAAVAMFYFGLPEYDANPLALVNIPAVAVMGALFAVLLYITSSSRNIIGSLLMGAVLGAVLYYAVYFVLELEYSAKHDITWLKANQIIGVVLLILAYSTIRTCYFKLPIGRRSHDNLLNPDFEERYLEPLHFTFRADAGSSFTSSIGTEMEEYADYLKSSIAKFFYRSIFSLIVVGFLSFLAVRHAPDIFPQLKVLLKEQLSQNYNPVGVWEGTFDGRDAVLEITECSLTDVKAVIKVTYSKVNEEKLTGKMDFEKKSIRLDDVERKNGSLDGFYVGEFSEDEAGEVLTGVYENYTSKKQVTFSFRKQAVPVETAAEPTLTNEKKK